MREESIILPPIYNLNVITRLELLVFSALDNNDLRIIAHIFLRTSRAIKYFRGYILRWFILIINSYVLLFTATTTQYRTVLMLEEYVVKTWPISVWISTQYPVLTLGRLRSYHPSLIIVHNKFLDCFIITE